MRHIYVVTGLLNDKYYPFYIQQYIAKSSTYSNTSRKGKYLHNYLYIIKTKLVVVSN